MGRRHRQREKLVAPSSEYRDGDANTLRLRGALTPASRREYASALEGGRHREDAQQRALEILFERLTVSWTIAGLELTRQQELLGRYRMSSGPERQFVRDAIREHVQANFPELPVP